MHFSFALVNHAIAKGTKRCVYSTKGLHLQGVQDVSQSIAHQLPKRYNALARFVNYQ
jgi:hypothetical protein